MDEPIDRIVPQVLASERIFIVAGFSRARGLRLPSARPRGRADRLYADVMLSLLLVAGVAAGPTKTRRFIRWCTLITLVLRWGAWVPGGALLAAWRELTTLAAVFLMTVAILRRVLAAGRVTTHRVQGAIIVYLLLGLSWANAYHIVETPSSRDRSSARPPAR